MVKLDTVHDINRDLVQSQPLVVVVTGGTGGIGALTLKALAIAVTKHEGQGLRAYIVGRNASAARKLVSECLSIYPKGQYYFIKADDLSLICNVDKTCKDIALAEERNAASANDLSRVDYLMLSHGGPVFLPRQGIYIPCNYGLPVKCDDTDNPKFAETVEGVDGTMSRFYYSRIAFISSLLPLLLKSSLPATVVSVYAAGLEAKIYGDDLSLRNMSHYSYSQVRSHVVYMHTCYFEELAKKHRGQLRAIHIFPGLVVHEGMYRNDNPWWLRFLFTKILPFFGADVDLQESGDRMVSLASPVHYPAQLLEETANSSLAITGTDGCSGSGSYALTWTGESTYPEKRYRSLDKDCLRQTVWDHTNETLEDIRNAGIFRD